MMIGPLASSPSCKKLLGPCANAVIYDKTNGIKYYLQNVACVCIYILRNYDKSFFSEVLRGWTDSATTVLPIITELLNNNIRVWVYRYG